MGIGTATWVVVATSLDEVVKLEGYHDGLEMLLYSCVIAGKTANEDDVGRRQRLFVAITTV